MLILMMNPSQRFTTSTSHAFT